ncbi:uncharacterized protein LOC144391074 [Gasterosteus aculeatus]
MAGRRLAFNSPSTPLRGHQLSASPQTNEKKLLKALSGSSRQLQQQTADINERFAPLERSGLCGFLSMEERNRLREEETGAQSHDSGSAAPSSQLRDELQALRTGARTNLSS